MVYVSSCLLTAQICCCLVPKPIVTPEIDCSSAGWLSAAKIGVQERLEIRRATGLVPQGALVVRDRLLEPLQALSGAFAFSSSGFGLSPGNPLSLIQVSETAQEAGLFGQWFDCQWVTLSEQPDAKAALIESLRELSTLRSPALLYALMLHGVFALRGDALDEEQVVKSATGIRNTVVWRKLFKFQRDGVVGAIDKLNRYGGCIIADSVGLGKTFEGARHHQVPRVA